jgi:hypothetical protein
VQRLADQVAGRFTHGVMAASATTFLFWSTIGVRLFPQVIRHSFSHPTTNHQIPNRFVPAIQILNSKHLPNTFQILNPKHFPNIFQLLPKKSIVSTVRMLSKYNLKMNIKYTAQIASALYGR